MASAAPSGREAHAENHVWKLLSLVHGLCLLSMRLRNEIDQEDGRAWTPGRRKLEGLNFSRGLARSGWEKCRELSP